MTCGEFKEMVQRGLKVGFFNLTTAERVAFPTHLRSCPACMAEFATKAGVPGLDLNNPRPELVEKLTTAMGVPAVLAVGLTALQDHARMARENES